MPLFAIWFMIAILPMLIFMEGFGMLQKFAEKRGYKIDILQAFLVLAILLFILFWSAGYRL